MFQTHALGCRTGLQGSIPKEHLTVLALPQEKRSGGPCVRTVRPVVWTHGARDLGAQAATETPAVLRK
jgi:hypothetical protein